MDGRAQSYLDRLRERHFPAERNYLAAHLTLFHALPGSEEATVHSQLVAVSTRQLAINGRATGLRSLGRGVAFVVDCPELITLRTALAQSWSGFLTPQDGQSWRPHITVQNKVTPGMARGLLEELNREFVPLPIAFEGLDLWRYEGGPWSLAQSYSWAD